MTSVSVLAPNGRRQNVKVTPNTTLLQVLEDVCKKQGLNPNEYNIKHFNKILDLSMVIRFSGLPNNAQLELVRSEVLRQESKVHIALQIGDSPTRLKADFWPSDNLMQVIETLSSDELKEETKTPVVIYMRKEMIGLDALRKTQLKTLGLTGGSAVLRLVLRDNDLPPEQKTSGNAVYFRSSVDTKTQNDLRTQEASSKAESKTADCVEAMDLSPSCPQENVQSTAFNSLPQTVPLELTHRSMRPEESRGTECEPNVTAKVCSATLSRLENTNQEVKQVESNEENNLMEVSTSESIEEEIYYIGERSALIFNLAAINSGSEEELPDDFFDLTVNDLRTLTRDYKRKLKEMEDNPLQTSAQRELKQSKQTLNRLNYKNTVIRIQFPDRLVLQAVFTPVETVMHVMDFVRKFLQEPETEFHLYMTPPKVILEPETHLVEADCVPRALIYFGTANCDNSSFLHSSYLANLTTPRQASKAALQYVRKINNDECESNADSSLSEMASARSEESSSSVYFTVSQVNRPTTSSSNNNNQSKNVVPKWFKK